MYAIYKAFLWIHIATAMLGFMSFWFAIGAREGSPLHRRAGRWFSRSMLATCALSVPLIALVGANPAPYMPDASQAGWLRHTGVMMGRPDFVGFFGLITLITVSFVYFGLRALRRPLGPGRFAVAQAGVLIVLGGVAGSYATQPGYELLELGWVVILLAGVQLTLMFRPRPTRAGWIVEHITGMFGAGLFAVAGFVLQLIPRIAPVEWLEPEGVGFIFLPLFLIATTATVWASRHFYRKWSPSTRRNSMDSQRGPRRLRTASI